ncbi:DUF2975 domain-containing protein [Methylocystis sp. JAN1]|uniref:DUF2975 domain-containing protein n=1 Tax=Methylocystis sp. JAN1 TaxID=3397211 RepID=UPI003FA3384A
MTHSAAFPLAGSPRLAALRAKIGWLCQAIRLLAIGYATLTLWGFYHSWATRSPYELATMRLFGLDVSGASEAQWNAVLAMSLALWLFVAALAFCVWRLFSTYLTGAVFSPEAALWLRRTGIAGLVAIVADFVERSAVVYTLAAHLPESANARHMFIRTEDFVHIILALMLLALAHIQKTAAEIADDNAQIV